jgi:hypothetical protein
LIIVYVLAISIFVFCVTAVAGALGVIIAIVTTPEDDYERDLADREQLEYIERWRERNETES